MQASDEITAERLLRLRLYNQRIAIHKEKTAAALIRHFGAMQAQDHSMAKWAMGARLVRSTEKNIQSAINRGAVIRTHVLRPTWHFVAPEDLSWMLMLTASRLHASSKSRLKQLGITPAVIAKSNKLLAGLLKGRSVTREEIMHAYASEKIKTAEYRGGHLLFEAELEGLICSGSSGNGEHTYALISERIQQTKTITKSEALKKLAKLYFQSHGPASIADFTWWSGLSPADAREAVSLNEKTIKKVLFNDQYLFTFDLLPEESELDKSVHLLPAYDEYTIAYKDREAAIDKRFLKKTISTNGIFYPLVVIGGRIAGLWKKQGGNKSIHITINQFYRIHSQHRELLESRIKDLEQFYGQKTTVQFTKL